MVFRFVQLVRLVRNILQVFEELERIAKDTSLQEADLEGTYKIIINARHAGKNKQTTF